MPLKHCLVFLFSILRPKEVCFCVMHEDKTLKACTFVQVAYVRTDGRTNGSTDSHVTTKYFKLDGLPIFLGKGIGTPFIDKIIAK